MIELTYIEHNEEFAKDLSIRKYFKTWKSVDKFVMKEKLEKLTLQREEILVSYDVEKLYPSISIKDAMICYDILYCNMVDITTSWTADRLDSA